MRIAELMQTDVKTITPDATVAELVQTLADSHVSGLPVVDANGHLIGVVTAGDVLRAEASRGETTARSTLFERTAVRDLMSPRPYVIAPDDDAQEAARHMLYAEVRRLFVEEQGKLVGVISQTDIAHAVGTGRL